MDKGPTRRWLPCVEVIDDKMAEVYGRMTPEQRANRCFEMFEFARGIAESAVRDLYPRASDAEVAKRVAERMARISD
ncbi:MAG: hypothetical protein K2Q20_05170 [Phycisphaerales bacterium]|nr:hypothetical protein [Phycisphaerales bacterium]